MIINPKSILNKGKFGSIEPSDAFLVDNGNLSLSPKDITVISGDIDILNLARKLKIPTLSSKRLRSLYIKERNLIDKSVKEIREELEAALKNPNLSTSDIFLLRIKRPYSGKWDDYSNEMLRLYGLRGRPTMKDAGKFESLTGLKSYVKPISQLLRFKNNALFYENFVKSLSLDALDKHNIEWYKKMFAPKYPNGAYYSKKNHHTLFDYNNWRNFFYDPATTAEFRYRSLLKLK